MILTVIGARPQFIKAAVVSKALQDAQIQENIIHTGQHYDQKMSDIFWKQLDLPLINENLEVGSGLHGKQTALIIEKLENYISNLTILPKAVLLYGDTNSTLAGAIVASKLNLPIIHIESGLRSFNREMPEETNRIVTDHLSDCLFCSSDASVEQLKMEGITNNVYCVGDVMYDAVKTFSIVANKLISLNSLIDFGEKDYSILTLHRPSNTDNIESVQSILSGLTLCETNIIWPIHPRIKNLVRNIKLPSNIYKIDPVGYLEMLTLLENCYKVFTDSGGLQKEAYWFKKPCITLRNETEWVETTHNNWNIITGINPDKVKEAFYTTINLETWVQLYGNYDSSIKIANKIKQLYFT
jgi:UDP-GlcNAc3NAcA epimerase